MIILAAFNLSSANAFNLDWSKILLGKELTSALHNILSKPLAAFPLNHHQNNGQRCDRNESCHNDYHQFLDRILAELDIKPATSCSQVMYAIYCAAGLGPFLQRGA